MKMLHFGKQAVIFKDPFGKIPAKSLRNKSQEKVYFTFKTLKQKLKLLF